MNTRTPLAALACLAALALLGGCATTHPYDYTNFRAHPPRSILILPPLNESTVLEGTYGYLSTVSRPVAELGYYVFPVEEVDRFFKENGMPTAGEMHQAPLNRIREVTGADAVLLVTLEQYGSHYHVINSTTVVKVRAQLVDTHSQVLLWEGHGEAEQGSILDAPFEDNSFDMIVTIGCLHHTGDLQKAINECHRMLRPDGKLMVMLYYAYSYRRWVQARGETLRYFWREAFGYRNVVQPKHETEKWNYDHNSKDEAAPHTDFVSVKSLKSMCKHFSAFERRLENINVEPPFQNWPSRRALLKTWRPQVIGLEIYATATK